MCYYLLSSDWIKNEKEIDENGEEEVRGFLWRLNEGKPMGRYREKWWRYARVWGLLGRVLVPSPSLDVKFIHLNSTSLSPLVRGWTDLGSQDRMGNNWLNWMQHFPSLHKKTNSRKFSYSISTDGVYCSIGERRQLDAYDCSNLKKVTKILKSKFLVQFFSHHFFRREKRRGVSTKMRRRKKRRKKSNRRKRKKLRGWMRKKRRKKKISFQNLLHQLHLPVYVGEDLSLAATNMAIQPLTQIFLTHPPLLHHLQHHPHQLQPHPILPYQDQRRRRRGRKLLGR